MSVRSQTSHLVSQFEDEPSYHEPQLDVLEDELQPPIPPRYVNAVAKADSAVVWWDIKNIYSDAIIHFEVKRYRLEEASHKWILKGTSKISNIEARNHTVRNLQPKRMYRFSVIGVNKIDKGLESKKSAPVFIEPDLPNGWFRLHDSASQRHFYYCPRSGKSSWTRPDENPYFVDYAIARHFTDREMVSMIDMYNDEIRNYECVSKYRLRDCVEEIGRPCCDVRYLHRAIRELVEGHTPELIAHDKAEKKEGKRLEKDCLRTFEGFMIMVQYIKYRALRVKQNPLYPLSELASLRMKNNSSNTGTRVGDWVLKRGSYLSKIVYRGVISKHKSFFAPCPYLVYLRPDKKQYFDAAFDPDEAQHIEKIYLYLDADMTGKVSLDEFCRFMTCLSVTYASRNNNRNDGKSPVLSRAMSHASSRVLLDNSSATEDMLDASFIRIFKLLDKGGKGYLKFEDFALFFVSLPTREAEVRRAYLSRHNSFSSISAMSTKSLPISEKQSPLSSKFSRKNSVAISESHSMKSVHEGSVDGDNDSVSVMSRLSMGSVKFKKTGSTLSDAIEISSIIEMDEDVTENQLQGNEFRIIDVAAELTELSNFHANLGDLSMIFDELLVSNTELTVWDTNKLQVSDMLITKSPPWFKKAFAQAKTAYKDTVKRMKEVFKNKREQPIQANYEVTNV